MNWIPSGQLWKFFYKCDWGVDDPSREKSWYASIMAKIAYLEIPAFERSGLDRVSLVPCADFRQIISQGIASSAAAALSEDDIPDIFVIQQPLLVAVGVRQKDILFVAVRGTKKLYDWLANLDAFKQPTPFGSAPPGSAFHLGFLNAATSLANGLSVEIAKALPNGNSKVVFCGHSLGGAICSVLHTNDGVVLSSGSFEQELNKHSRECYSFGAPRYANAPAINHFRTPHAYVRPLDIVPTVPPMWLGYNSPKTVYDCASNLTSGTSQGSLGTLFGWIASLATGVGVVEHDLELYIADLTVP